MRRALITVPTSSMHPLIGKFMLACALIDALKNPILPLFDSSPEGKHHCPAEHVEECHESGYDSDGHCKRVDVVADRLANEEGVEHRAEEYDAPADGKGIGEQPHEEGPEMLKICRFETLCCWHYLYTQGYLCSRF